MADHDAAPCVKRTIEHDLPFETGFLRRHDEFRRRIEGVIDMPGRTIDLLFRLLGQNNGTLSNRAREKEFAALTDEEAQRVEAIYSDIFADPTDLDVNLAADNGLGRKWHAACYMPHAKRARLASF